MILSVAKLVTYHPPLLETQPTRAMWLFAVLTQVQIFLTLIAAGFPALKQAVLDLSTSFGVAERSHDRSRSGRSYSLKTLTSKGKKLLQEHPRPANRRDERATAMTGTSDDSDDGSQRGIIRQQE